jgi:hypothetical protein
MVGIVLMRVAAQSMRLLPRPLHNALDAWSYRLALKRRDRRFRGVSGRSAAYGK